MGGASMIVTMWKEDVTMMINDGDFIDQVGDNGGEK